LKYALQPKIDKKINKTVFFQISRSFKVINIGTAEKLASSACYDQQQVCLSVTVITITLDEQIVVI